MIKDGKRVIEEDEKEDMKEVNITTLVWVHLLNLPSFLVSISLNAIGYSLGKFMDFNMVMDMFMIV